MFFFSHNGRVVVWLSFFILIIIEHVILYVKKGTVFRLNDQVTSLSHWIFQESVRVLFRGCEYYAYIIIHEKYLWWDLPWNSSWTWCVSALAVDFCYYWLHRSNHEVHFLWAQHQVHHSSEEFNLSVGLRQSVFQHWCNFIFYLPLALFIPPSHFIAHYQFNLIYQLWIHTMLIDDLGPLELIFNTPKHHRVHHGCNLYCLDKNYGGVLIIWDRIFGTFRDEEKKEDIIYGLVVSARSFNPLYLQMFYTRDMIKKSLCMKSLNDKLAAFWKGPSWFPGSPRLGLDEFKINVTSRIKYDTCIPMWQTFYIIVHFALAFYNHIHLYDILEEKVRDVSTLSIIMNNIFALTTIGLLFDKYEYAGFVEFTRCVIFLLYYSKQDSLIHNFTHYVYIFSCCAWIIFIVRRIKTETLHQKYRGILFPIKKYLLQHLLKKL
ncbi:alkylglycerol monooxygenase-like isoform X2 [Prorops nasuta]|uniref:alkylglycerol monooxygenase-like isoform X2 n=1 Tax=Prorops nasuta TaxID=863751 RepID=UPI0034CD7243